MQICCLLQLQQGRYNNNNKSEYQTILNQIFKIEKKYFFFMEKDISGFNFIFNEKNTYKNSST